MDATVAEVFVSDRLEISGGSPNVLIKGVAAHREAAAAVHDPLGVQVVTLPTLVPANP